MAGENPTPKGRANLRDRIVQDAIAHLLRPNRVVYAEGEGDGAGGSGEGEGATPPEPKPEGEGKPPETGGETAAKIEEARREAISERKKRQELEAKVKEFEEAKLTEAEKKDKALAEAEREKLSLTERLQAIEVERAVERAAGQAGMRDPSDAALTINRSLLAFEEDGTPKAESVTKALEDLKGRKPHLFGEEPPGSADGGARSPASVSPDLREMVKDIPRM